TDCPFAYSSARTWSSSTLTPNTLSPTDAYVERLRLSAFNWVAQGPQRLPQKLTTTTSPRCSDNRTLLPTSACNAKSGASLPMSGYGAAATATAPSPPRLSRDTKKRRWARAQKTLRCDTTRHRGCGSPKGIPSPKLATVGAGNPRIANLTMSTNAAATSRTDSRNWVGLRRSARPG